MLIFVAALIDYGAARQRHATACLISRRRRYALRGGVRGASACFDKSAAPMRHASHYYGYAFTLPLLPIIRLPPPLTLRRHHH